ncbi:MAG: extracellular solute-binding protein [Deltaproteobacteria bacterium]|nr:extracellular solute-binding protein [Deltaproteobacteria bacterium]
MNFVFRKFITLSLLFSFITLNSFFGTTESQASWETEWKKTVEAAKKEGVVTVYTSSRQSNLLLESGAFQKAYPDIKLLVALGNPLYRILTERRVGKYLADVGLTGPSTLWRLYKAKALDPVKDAMILPEVTDESKWFTGKHLYVDKEQKYILVSVGNPDSGNFYYNTNLINPKKFKSMWDFLKPEWKGKITARDVRSPGPGSVTIKFYYYNPDLGVKFIKKLFGEMDLTLFRNQRQGIDWLSSGRFPICVFCNSSRIENAKVQGLPVEKFAQMKEGAVLSSSGGGLTLINRAPHPNAARVFINWYLSREGQLALQSLKGGFTNSRRIDISRDMIPPDRRLEKDGKYMVVDTWDRISTRPVLKIINASLADAQKRKKNK